MAAVNKAAVRAALEKLRGGGRPSSKSTNINSSNSDHKPIPTAEITKPTTAKINNKYQDINDVNLSISRQASTWTDENFNALKIFNIDQLGIDDAVLFGKHVFASLNSESVTSDVLFMMLYLAISCRSTLDINDYLLTKPTGMTKMMDHTRPTLDEDTNVTITAEDDGLDDILNESTSKPSKKNNKKGKAKKGEVSDKVKQAIQDARGGVTTERAQSSEKVYMAAAYSYMAAFLMRLQCRQPDARMVESITKAAKRYSGFYDSGLDAVEELSINEEALTGLRDIIARKPEVTSTWIAWVAYNENEKEMVKQDFGLLEYLATQVFSYQGMHVVTQTLAIHQITAVPMGLLLREMDCQMTRAAVQEIYKIVKDYHKNAKHPERKTYYRYARVWNEGYFARVQSKSCAQLLYLAAKIVKDIGTNNNSDPTQIYAVRDLAAASKERLDKVASNIVNFIYRQAAEDDEAGESWKV